MITIILACAALCGSAFFSASETALFSIPRERIFFFQKNPEKNYLRIFWLLKNGQKTLLMILFGNIFVNITLTGLIHAVLRKYLNLESEVLTLFVATAVIVVFGEILPKNIALKHNERIARIIALPLQAIVKVCQPVLTIIQSVNHIFLVRFRLHLRDPGPFVTVNELKSAVNKSMKDGALSADEGAVVHRILDQGAMPARKYMIHRSNLVIVDEKADVQTVVADMKESSSSIALLQHNDHRPQISGIVRLSSLFSASADVPVRTFSEEMIWAPESSEVAELIQYLFECKHTEACLIDEFGGFSGLFSVNDAVMAIFGDLFQRVDKAQTKSVGTLLKGSMEMQALRNFVPQALLDNASAWRTVNGVLTNYLGRIPKAGETFAINDSKFYIITASPTKIEQVLIQKGENNDN